MKKSILNTASFDNFPDLLFSLRTRRPCPESVVNFARLLQAFFVHSDTSGGNGPLPHFTKRDDNPFVRKIYVLLESSWSSGVWQLNQVINSFYFVMLCPPLQKNNYRRHAHLKWRSSICLTILSPTSRITSVVDWEINATLALA